MRIKTIKASNERDISIVMSHNCVSCKITQNHTDSELKEVLRHLKPCTVKG